MTEKELQAIRARAEAATEGKWLYDDTDNVMISDAPNYKEVPVIAEDFPFKPDAEFIAAARQDVPKLLAEVARLTNRLNEADNLLSEAHDLMDDVHCYETDVYNAISKYFNGEEAADE